MSTDNYTKQLFDLKATWRWHRHLWLTLLSGILLGAQVGHSQINTFPHTESFENGGALPAGWTTQNVNGSGVWQMVTANGNFSIIPRTGTYMAEFRTTASFDMAMLISPSFDLTSLNNPQLSFYYANVNWFGDIDDMQVYYSEDDGENWTPLGDLIDQEHTSWTEAVYSLPSPSSTYKIAFESMSFWARGFNIDDVTVGEAPACPSPMVQSVNVLAESAILDWQQQGGATEWEIEYGTTPFIPTGVPNVMGIFSHPYELEGLSPSTQYSVYLRANCGEGETSSWVGPITFTTRCATITTFPFHETFEDDSNTLECWMVFEDDAFWYLEEGSYSGNIYSAHGGELNAALGYDLYGGVAELVSPIMDLTGLANGAQLSFWYANPQYLHWLIGPSIDLLSIYYSADGGETWNVLPDAEFGAQVEEWTEVVIQLPNPSDKYIIDFVGINGGGLVLDDIIIGEAPPCPNPTTLSANTTISSATLEWNGPESATEWDVEFGLAGFSPTGIPTHPGILVESLTIIDLDAQTEYEFYVRADCAVDGESAWSGPFAFTTAPCIPQYSEDPDEGTGDGDVISNVVISGTTLSNNSGTASGTPTYVSYPATGSTTATLNAGTSYNISVTNGSYEFGGQNVAVWIDFNSDGIFETPSERVGYSSSAYTSGFQTINFPISLPCDPTPGDYRMRVRMVYGGAGTNGSTIDPCAFAFYGETEDYTVTVAPPPPCPAPSAGSASAITYNSASISWTAGCNETSWDVHLTTAGGGAPAGTPSNVNATAPLVLSVLPLTNYEFWVRANCEGDGYSAWSGPFTFNTPAAPPVNDNCGGAIALTYGQTLNATTVSATQSIPAGSCGGNPDDDVWFSFVASSNPTRITTSGYDGVIEIRSGACNGTYVTCVDQGGSTDVLTTSALTGGETYYIRFYSYGGAGAGGAFTINLQEIIVPVNDNCAGAVALTIGQPYNGSTSNATQSISAGTCGGTADDDVWFSFVAPAYPINIFATGLDGVLELRSGSCNGTLIDCIDQIGYSDLLSDMSLTEGQTYLVRYYSYFNGVAYTGPYTMVLLPSEVPAPANDEPSATVPNIFNSLNTYPNCVEIQGTTAGATPTFDPDFNDVWYRFTAQTNGVSIRLESAIIDGMLEIYDSNLQPVAGTFEDVVISGYAEVLNYGDLIPGNQYFLRVGSYIDDDVVDGSFSICLQHLKRPSCASTTTTLCHYYVSSNHTPYSNTFNFTDSNNEVHSFTTTNYQVQLSHPGLGLRYNETYSVNLTSNYRLEDGFGDIEVIQVSGLNTCSVTIADHSPLVVKANQRCTTGTQLARSVLLTQQVQSGSGVCGTTGYRIEFTPVANCNGDNPNGAQTFSRVINAPNTGISLNYAFNHLPEASNPNVGYWSVRWKPRFAGYEGTYGPAYVVAVKKTAGAPAMELENTQEPVAGVSDMSEISANVYPNPNNGELVNLNITGLTGTDVYVRIMDSMGREVYTNRYTAEGSLNTIVNFSQPLAQGLYMVEFRDGDRVVTQRMMVTK
jgi:hypothetical protein